MTKKLKLYPQNCNDDGQRTEYLYRVQELLRLHHNEWGKKFRDSEINEIEWSTFLKEWDEKNIIIVNEILKYRQKHKECKKYDIKLDELFEDE